MPARLPLKNERHGFTLVEVLISLGILTVALLGIAATTALQTGGIAGSIPFGQTAVTRGYHLSTATMLAQDRLEQVKRQALASFPPAGFPDENPVPGFPNFTRQVTITAGPADTREVTVIVAYTLPTDWGANQESIRISTLVAARP